MKRIEILLRHLLLRLLLIFRWNANRNDSPVITKDSRILFIRLNRIGDALVTTPLLKEIKEQIGCKVFLLAGNQNYFIFENAKLADEIIVYRKNVHGIRSLIKMINTLQLDAIVDLHDDISTTVSYLIAFSKCKYKFGLRKGNFKLYTHTVPKIDPSKFHVVDRVLEFKKLFGLNVNSGELNIVYEPKVESVRSVSDYLKNHFAAKKFLVGINISAGSDARFWGASKFSRIIESLKLYDVNLILLCSEKDLESAAQIASAGIPIFYRPTFDEFCAMLPFLNFLITPDTSIIHVASAFKLPMFGLYVHFQTSDKIWTPYKSEFDCVVTEEPTLKNISVEEVENKLIPFFEKFYFHKG